MKNRAFSQSWLTWSSGAASAFFFLETICCVALDAGGLCVLKALLCPFICCLFIKSEGFRLNLKSSCATCLSCHCSRLLIYVTVYMLVCRSSSIPSWFLPSGSACPLSSIWKLCTLPCKRVFVLDLLGVFLCLFNQRGHTTNRHPSNS